MTHSSTERWISIYGNYQPKYRLHPWVPHHPSDPSDLFKTIIHVHTINSLAKQVSNHRNAEHSQISWIHPKYAKTYLDLPFALGDREKGKIKNRKSRNRHRWMLPSCRYFLLNSPESPLLPFNPFRPWGPRAPTYDIELRWRLHDINPIFIICSLVCAYLPVKPWSPFCPGCPGSPENKYLPKMFDNSIYHFYVHVFLALLQYLECQGHCFPLVQVSLFLQVVLAGHLDQEALKDQPTTD